MTATIVPVTATAAVIPFDLSNLAGQLAPSSINQ